MSVFADSSALVKLYADEEGAEEIHSLSGIVVSVLARVEVPAALWRKERIGDLSAEDASILARAFGLDMLGGARGEARFQAVGVEQGVLERAADMLAAHRLRAYDAVQLASAVAARGADPSCTQFACFDTHLRRAAAAQGFALLP